MYYQRVDYSHILSVSALKCEVQFAQNVLVLRKETENLNGIK